MVLAFVGLFAAQMAILIGSAPVERVGVIESLGSTMTGAFQFWLIMVAVAMVTAVLD